MRILLVHDNYFSRAIGGEHNVVMRELDMLRWRGVEARLLQWETAQPNRGMIRKAFEQGRGIYSSAARRRMAAEITAFRPDVVHVHNFWPQATPAVHHSARHAGIPVVQSLHNYRILCVADILLRAGHPCELCIEASVPWPAVRHRCIRGSPIRSAIWATAFGAHRLYDTWNRCVDAFIAPTESVRARFIRGGIDARRIVVHPQWAPDGGAGTGERRYFLFVGRLSAEKGILMLLEAWRGRDDAELWIAGTGHLEPEVRTAAARQPNIRYLGEIGADAIGTAMRGAIATIVPSLWEEPFPLVIAESYAAGTPVIAADSGSRAETVAHEQTGLLFATTDTEGLKSAVSWVLSHPSECSRMGDAARQRYESAYSEEAGWKRLHSLYDALCARRKLETGT